MNAQTNDLLESLVIDTDIARLDEEGLFHYLAKALDECGVEHSAVDLEGLVEEAEQAYSLEEGRASRRRREARRRRDASRSAAASSRSGGTKKGWKKVFGVLRKVGRVAGKAALWGGGAALKTAGWAAKGIGAAAQHAGQGMHNANSKIAWSKKD